jgi:hypothetical protein
VLLEFLDVAEPLLDLPGPFRIRVLVDAPLEAGRRGLDGA